MATRSFYSWLKSLDNLHKVTLRFPVVTLPVRLASHILYRSLELLLGSRHPHGRVISQAQKLETSQVSGDTETTRTVLFFTVRGWYAHAGTEAILAKALEQRGAETSFFLCGGILSQCDFKPGTDPHVTRPLCWRCTGFAKRLFSAFGLRCTFLEDIVPPESRPRAKRLLESLNRTQLEEFVYDDLPLHEIVKPSAQRSLLRGDIGTDDLSESVYRGFLESAVVFVDACKKLLDLEHPDVVVMTNGLFFAERIMLMVAKRRSIRCVTYERGMRVGTVLLAHDRPVIDFDLDEPWKAAQNRPLKPDESQTLSDYLSSRRAGSTGVIDLWPEMERPSKLQLLNQLGLTSERPVVSAFPNILWDSAVYGRDVFFDGLFDWLESTIEVAAGENIQLVIRVHPAEIRIPMSESRDRVTDRLSKAFPVLPENVTVIPPDDSISSYPLVDISDLVLVYTSTIGLEAATAGKRVLVAGRTHYRGRGFTEDVSDRAHYGRQMHESLQSGKLSAEQVELARRYANLFFLEFQQSFPWIIDTPRSERRLCVDTLEELALQEDPTLDRICEGILAGRPFVVDR